MLLLIGLVAGTVVQMLNQNYTLVLGRNESLYSEVAVLSHYDSDPVYETIMLLNNTLQSRLELQYFVMQLVNGTVLMQEHAIDEWKRFQGNPFMEQLLENDFKGCHGEAQVQEIHGRDYKNSSVTFRLLHNEVTCELGVFSINILEIPQEDPVKFVWKIKELSEVFKVEKGVRNLYIVIPATSVISGGLCYFLSYLFWKKKKYLPCAWRKEKVSSSSQ